MKACKDCKNFNEYSFDCIRGKREAGTHVIWGYTLYKHRVLEPAHWQRESILPWKCGKKARHFEPKAS